MDTLPTFPTIDLEPTINWMVTGVTGIMSSNAGLIIGASLAMVAVPVAISKIKSLAKGALRG